MADLIRRSYILKIIEMWMKVPSYSESERNIMRAIDYEVRTAPSAEPEIIRCKDCKNYYPDEDGRGYHCERDSNVRFSVHKDFYCADAERRTEATGLTFTPNKHIGEWTKAYDGNDGHVKCTACFKTYDYVTQAQHFNYCPNCGARMVGWKEENGDKSRVHRNPIK